MKQLLLATALIAAPVAGFSAWMVYLAPATAPQAAAAASAGLGDMSAFKTIVADVQTIAAGGDFTGAEKRITDYETAWDDAAARLRALDGTAWGTVDDASDAALKALRAGTPDAAAVTGTLDALMSALDSPAGGSAGTAAAGVTTVSGIAVTDANGRALPCEEMLKSVSAALAASAASAADKVGALDLQAKGTERCNADDDARADAFSAQALALLGKSA